MPPVPIALGTSDFTRIRDQGCPYADKTAAMARLIQSGTDVAVFCRPRRFGKSLLLSTLRTFLERRDVDHSHYFADLAIWEDAGARAHFQRYPVLHLSFKGMSGPTFSLALSSFASHLRRECVRLARHWPGLLDVGGARLQKLLDDQTGYSELVSCLPDITGWLAEVSGERVVLLLDEYDAPLHRAHSKGYYPEMVELLRTMLGEGLKENRALWKAVVTGVLRISREGIWSALNNIRIYSVMDHEYADAIGLSEEDVVWLIEQTRSPLSIEEMRSWYNGYNFSGHTVYNPWSVLHALEATEFRAWWMETASNEALAELVRRGGEELQRKLRRWLAGESLPAFIGDTILLREEREEDVVPLLVHSGYLSPVDVQPRRRGWQAMLSVPNEDVLQSLQEAAQRWLSEMRMGRNEVEEMQGALLAGDLRFGDLLGRLLIGVSSFHDFPFPDKEGPYHTFLLGLLSTLRPDYQILSNVEAGLGRADILVLPARPGGTGVVIEMKRAATPEEGPLLLAAAGEQALSRRYDTRLREAGVKSVVVWGIAFCGKECWVSPTVIG